MLKVALVMGSDSDLPIVKKATAVLDELQIPYEVHVYSAHRTPAAAAEFASSAAENGFGVIIAFAGMAAHLAGAMAANSILPVIGVPCGGSSVNELAALLATVQMPSGIPVATVGVDNGKNAAILAAQMIALGDIDVCARLVAMREEASAAVLAKDACISEKLKE